MGQSKGCKAPGKPFGKDNPPPISPGRPKLDERTKKIRNLTTDQFVKDFNDLLTKSIAELEVVVANPKESSLRAYMASCLIEGKRKGDYWTLNLMLDRIIGKVKEPANPDSENTLKALLDAMLNAAKVTLKDAPGA